MMLSSLLNHFILILVTDLSNLIIVLLDT